MELRCLRSGVFSLINKMGKQIWDSKALKFKPMFGEYTTIFAYFLTIQIIVSFNDGIASFYQSWEFPKEW